MELLVQGKEIPDACGAIRMFSLCANMKWSHLPVPGGIYAQDPQLLEQFRYIFSEQARHDEKEMKEKESKTKRAAGSLGHPSKGSY